MRNLIFILYSGLNHRLHNWGLRLFKVLLIFSTLNIFSQQNQTNNFNIDSLVSIVKTTNTDTTRIKALNDLADKLIRSREYKRALNYAGQAITISEKLFSSPLESVAKSAKKGLANAYFNIGKVNHHEAQFNIALEYYFKCVTIRTDMALQYPNDINNKKRIALAYNNIAMAYDDQGNYPKAMEQHLKALTIYEEVNDKRSIATSHNGIALIFLGENDFMNAEKHALISLRIRKEINDQQGIGYSLNNLGNICTARGDRCKADLKEDLYKKALDYYIKSLKIKEEIKDVNGIGNSYINVGLIYFSLGNISKNTSAIKNYYKTAMKYFLDASRINGEFNDKKGMAAASLNLGSLNIKLKNYKKAEEYLKSAMKLTLEIHYREAVIQCYGCFFDLARAQNDWKSAYKYHKLYVISKDSINNEEYTKKTVKAQMNYEFNKKEQAAKLQEEKKEAVAASERKKQKIIIGSVSLGLILVLILALVILKSLRDNQKKNKIITQQKELVELQKSLVEEKQKEILDSIHYAKRIQNALITSEKYFDKNLHRIFETIK